jgi:peptide/nickel transport system substrate-binding protein
LVLGACSSGTTTSTTEPQSTSEGVATTSTEGTSSEETTTSETETPEDRTIVLTLSADPDTLNPAVASGVSNQIGGKVYDALVHVNHDMTEITPELATSWDISDDGRTYTFHLRDDVSWHDGMPFTSADVKWSMENVNLNHPVGRRILAFVESIETPDDYTVVFNLSQSFGPFLGGLHALVAGAINPKHIGEAATDPVTDEILNRRPIGTGPFMFEEWQPGQSISIVRNPDYWGDEPWLERIIWTIIPDSGAMLLALENREIDWIDSLFVQRSDLPLYEDHEFISIMANELASTNLLMLNHRRPPFDDVRVRQALSMAIDREFLVDAVYAGYSEVPLTMIDHRLRVAESDDVDLTEMYPYDPVGAAALLDEAGVLPGADGDRFDVEIIYDAGWQGMDESVEAIVPMWAEIGVTLIPRPMERATFVDMVFSNRDFDATISSFNTLQDPALGVSRVYTCEDDAAAVNHGNPTGYCNPEVDRLFSEAAAAVEFEDRRAIYAELQVLLAAEFPLIPVVANVERGLANTGEWDFSVALTSYRNDSGATWVYVKRNG